MESIVALPHHSELPLCQTRASYRQGRELTAVKVYTVFDESRHLLLRNVTCIDVADELAALCEKFGRLRRFCRVGDYETERFTSVYHVQFGRIAAARFAKRHLDGRSFYGTHLKVCYAPELESTADTADKVLWRRLSYCRALSRPRTSAVGGSGESLGQVLPEHDQMPPEVPETSSSYIGPVLPDATGNAAKSELPDMCRRPKTSCRMNTDPVDSDPVKFTMNTDLVGSGPVKFTMNPYPVGSGSVKFTMNPDPVDSGPVTFTMNTDPVDSGSVKSTGKGASRQIVFHRKRSRCD